MLASSCSQLETIRGSGCHQQYCIPEIRVCPAQGGAATSAAPSATVASAQSKGQVLTALRKRAGRGEKDGEVVGRNTEGLPRFMRSHSEPGLSSSTDTGELNGNNLNEHGPENVTVSVKIRDVRY